MDTPRGCDNQATEPSRDANNDQMINIVANENDEKEKEKQKTNQHSNVRLSESVAVDRDQETHDVDNDKKHDDNDMDCNSNINNNISSGSNSNQIFVNNSQSKADQDIMMKNISTIIVNTNENENVNSNIDDLATNCHVDLVFESQTHINATDDPSRHKKSKGISWDTACQVTIDPDVGVFCDNDHDRYHNPIASIMQQFKMWDNQRQQERNRSDYLRKEQFITGQTEHKKKCHESSQSNSSKQFTNSSKSQKPKLKPKSKPKRLRSRNKVSHQSIQLQHGSNYYHSHLNSNSNSNSNCNAKLDGKVDESSDLIRSKYKSNSKARSKPKRVHSSKKTVSTNRNPTRNHNGTRNKVNQTTQNQPRGRKKRGKNINIYQNQRSRPRLPLSGSNDILVTKGYVSRNNIYQSLQNIFDNNTIGQKSSNVIDTPLTWSIVEQVSDLPFTFANDCDDDNNNDGIDFKPELSDDYKNRMNKRAINRVNYWISMGMNYGVRLEQLRSNGKAIYVEITYKIDKYKKLKYFASVVAGWVSETYRIKKKKTFDISNGWDAHQYCQKQRELYTKLGYTEIGWHNTET